MGTRELFEKRKARKTQERQRREEQARPLPATVNGHGGHGPGSQLKRVCGWFDLRPTKTCACGDQARIMDSRGADWCRANVPLIVSWLERERTERGWTCAGIAWHAVRYWVRETVVRSYRAADRFVFALVARGLVRLAIWMARNGHA